MFSKDETLIILVNIYVHISILNVNIYIYVNKFWSFTKDITLMRLG